MNEAILVALQERITKPHVIIQNMGATDDRSTWVVWAHA